MTTTKASLFLSGIGNDVCNPFFDASGTLHVIFSSSGEISSISATTGQVTVVHNTMGQPSGAAFDVDGVMFVADFAHASVLSVLNMNQEAIVTVYEDKPLKGI